MSKIEKSLYITSIVLLFQILRNVSLIGYIGILFIMYAILYMNFLFNRNSHIVVSSFKNSFEYSLIKFLFILSLFWIPIISLHYLNSEQLMISLPRFLVTLPFILFCVFNKSLSKNVIIKVLRAICIFMMIASLSIPFQILFGKIYFLADSGTREGFERFASLAGSLTALGTLGIFSIAILLFTGDILFNKRIKYIILILTILGMLVSFQKAAIANLIICFGFYFLLNSNVKVFKRIQFIFIILMIMLIVYYFCRNTTIGLYIQSIFKYSMMNQYSELSIVGDLLNRLWYYPSMVIEYNEINFVDLFFGIGLGALSGTMGLPELPMSHNNYFDLVFSGGIVHFTVFMLLLVRVPLKVFNKKINRKVVNEIEIGYAVVLLLVLINMLIGAASFYQPISSVVIFFIIFSYDSASQFDLSDKKYSIGKDEDSSDSIVEINNPSIDVTDCIS